MDALRELETLVAVVEEGSLTNAARRLGRSLQAVSRSLQMLEKAHGATLIVRTTRTCHPSPAGVRFYERVKGAFAELELARTELAEEAQQLAGRLRVNAPTLFGPAYVAPLAGEFLQRHPGLTLSLELSDDFRDPSESGADVTIRIGETPDSRLVARRLGTIRRVAYAAPGYLAQHGRPLRPQDLASHACVVRTGLPNPSRWTFRSRQGEEIAVNVSGRFDSDRVAAVNAGVAAGMGIGLAAFWQIRDWLEAGRVELVLPDYEPAGLPLHALWLRTRKLPARTRLLIDFLAARLMNERL
ncbi:LysR family transcriptional regulator [Paraburkholderia phenazinium]|jgi:DNA-binding transcriptional LysR family regulator|uniref:DNA-binding transcriptional regulator, LysR family n=1 Tax=Paraburkholderia phenazinium TaxID=60549 RepID=A0A1G8FB52_9BURK|nr:LysR family transcriptional regulator [Paraburkholderia phenazinium]SDH79381.1 DNA-binding transcriptional regulator, LysR family [Paraburkholderia phenazinium]